VVQELWAFGCSRCIVPVSGLDGGGEMNNIIDWIKENKGLAIGIALGVLGVIAIIVLIVLLYEPPLKQGKIVDIQATADSVMYDQHQDDHYRNITKYRTVTKYHTDGNGNRTPYTDRESYTDRVFDHTEYYIERHFNGADFIITIEAESQKHPGKIITNKIWVTQSRYSTVKDQKGQTFVFDDTLGDKRYDFNNTVQEVDRQWYTSFDLIRWMSAHGVANSP